MRSRTVNRIKRSPLCYIQTRCVYSPPVTSSCPLCFLLSDWFTPLLPVSVSTWLRRGAQQLFSLPADACSVHQYYCASASCRTQTQSPSSAPQFGTFQSRSHSKMSELILIQCAKRTKLISNQMFRDINMVLHVFRHFLQQLCVQTRLR